jgi:galactose-1-phosphate uridylyltransferase
MLSSVYELSWRTSHEKLKAIRCGTQFQELEGLFLSLSLRKEIRKACLLNPTRNFETEEQVLERRFDPLTGLSTFVAKGRLQYIKRYFSTDRRLLEKLAEASRPDCPFCPERVEHVTPKFPKDITKEGRIKIGKCIAFPSLHAHSDFNAVIVLGPTHLAYPRELGAETLAEGLTAGLEALKAAYKANPELAYGTIIMNYLPPAGSSIIHPHMQALASNVPFNHQRLLLVKSYQYYVQTSRNYWAQLIEHEKKSQERFVCEGNYLAWITPFAPLRFFEVWGVFKEPLKPTELESKHLAELADGLSRILAYYEDRDILCVNIALILPRFETPQVYFNPQVRVCARFGLAQPFLSDFWAMATLLHESEVVELPEDYAAELRRYFR